jgi:V/A-type H+-transporting ATPase subunit F
VNRIIEADDRPDRQVQDVIKDGSVGIVIIEEQTFNRLPPHLQEELQDIVRPTFVVLSTRASQDSLRRMIKKSIGVDLWEK